MLKHAAALLLLAFIAHGIIVGPAIYEQDDFGDIAWSEFTYSLSADCTAATITTIVMNESNKPVKDANAYLKYIDFSSPLIGSAVSDKDGYVLHKLPGDVKLMRGLFILVIEKKGYRTKEVHFDLYPCFHNGSMPPKPAPPAPPPVKPQPTTNATKPPNDTVITVPPPAANNTTDPGDAPAQAPLCPLGILLLAIPFINFYQEKPS